LIIGIAKDLRCDAGETNGPAALEGRQCREIVEQMAQTLLLVGVDRIVGQEAVTAEHAADNRRKPKDGEERPVGARTEPGQTLTGAGQGGRAGLQSEVTVEKICLGVGGLR
jgi:hypothetical protein